MQPRLQFLLPKVATILSGFNVFRFNTLGDLLARLLQGIAYSNMIDPNQRYFNCAQAGI
jgi:hypothetical protein